MSTVESIARPRRNGERRRAPFFFNDTATPEISTLSQHVALPITTCVYTPAFAEALRQAHPEADRDGDGTLSRSASDRKSTRLNSSHSQISYAVFCLKKKNVYRRVNSKATTQWRKTESSNGVHLAG